MTASDTDAVREKIQLLVVADTWCYAESACDEVWQTIGERPGRIFVVTPTITGRLHALVSDIGKCRPVEPPKPADRRSPQARNHTSATRLRAPSDTGPSIFIRSRMVLPTTVSRA